MSRRAIALITALFVAGGGTLFFLTRDEDPDNKASEITGSRATFASDDPIERGCALGTEMLKRIARGVDPDHSEEIIFVPQEPNFTGTFDIPNHSGPWDYLQNVPLVFYGPGNVRAQGAPLDRDASVTDIYPTIGALTGTDLPEREGRVLGGALEDDASPKVVLMVVWDGVGRNVLERWPGRWPTLEMMERDGTSYLGATVGSSPSITPATHSSMGTGAFPDTHGVTGIKFRDDEGVLREPFAKRDPADLTLTTFGDDIDKAFDNRSLVGMIAWRSWHMGMLSHGSQIEGADRDLLGIVGHDENITGNDTYYYTPPYLTPFDGLADRIEELDIADGKADGLWMGHDIAKLHDNPAWIEYLADAIIATLGREGFGADEIPDVFTTNFKMTDIVGHQYTMDSDEMGVVLEAQDAALGRIIDFLDAEVKDYVVIVTSDHGHTPAARRTGAWPIQKSLMIQHMEKDLGGDIASAASAVGIYLNPKEMDRVGVTEDDVSRWVNGYELERNWTEDDLPAGYEDRADEKLFSAAFSRDDLPEIMACAREAEQS